MKNKINLDVIINEDKWLESVDFDAQKVAFELKDLVFDYVKKECQHELLSYDKELPSHRSVSCL